jgi:hypothetical protein
MSDQFVVITKHCSDCGNVIEGREFVVGIYANKRRGICGFCFTNPGWPAVDPTYRDRILARNDSGRGAFKGRLQGRHDPRTHNLTDRG